VTECERLGGTYNHEGNPFDNLNGTSGEQCLSAFIAVLAVAPTRRCSTATSKASLPTI